MKEEVGAETSKNELDLRCGRRLADMLIGLKSSV